MFQNSALVLLQVNYSIVFVKKQLFLNSFKSPAIYIALIKIKTAINIDC